MGEENGIPQEVILSKIYLVRGQKVMLDRDLAELYGVATKRLNEQVKRNIYRFPSDFMFQLSTKEWENLRSHFATSSWGGRRTNPFVFTEHGVLMLSSVLKSKQAVVVNIHIMRAYVKIRSMLLTHKDILIKLDKLERRVGNQDEKISQLFQYLKQFIKENQSPRKQIGYKSPN